MIRGMGGIITVEEEQLSSTSLPVPHLSPASGRQNLRQSSRVAVVVVVVVVG